MVIGAFRVQLRRKGGHFHKPEGFGCLKTPPRREKPSFSAALGLDRELRLRQRGERAPVICIGRLACHHGPRRRRRPSYHHVHGNCHHAVPFQGHRLAALNSLPTAATACWKRRPQRCSSTRLGVFLQRGDPGSSPRGESDGTSRRRRADFPQQAGGPDLLVSDVTYPSTIGVVMESSSAGWTAPCFSTRNSPPTCGATKRSTCRVSCRVPPRRGPRRHQRFFLPQHPRNQRRCRGAPVQKHRFGGRPLWAFQDSASNAT